MTAQALMAEHTERIGKSLVNFIATTEPSMLTWTQSDPNGYPSRSVMEQVTECVTVNRYFAALLRGKTPGAPSPVKLTSSEEAQQEITASSEELASAIRTLSDEGLEKEYMHHSRGPIPGFVLIVGGFRNMTYHAGQINFIQILGRDQEFHVPTNWLK